MENNFSIFSLNTSEQNECLAWHCLKNHDMSAFESMLDSEMPLTSFMLTAMLCLSYDKEVIKGVLKKAKIVEPNVIPWMQNCFELEELTDILPEYDELLPKGYPSDEDCVRLKLWKALLKRQSYNVLAQNAPEVLEKHISMSSSARLALLKADFAKYADIILKNGYYCSILQIKDGWKYLIDHGKAVWVLQHELQDFAIEKEEIAKYCLEKGLLQELYDAEFYDLLLQNNHVDVFVKNHSNYQKFLEQYPDKVDWEDLWTFKGENDKMALVIDAIRKRLLKTAKKHKDIPACVEFLKKHGSWWDKLWL